MIAYTLRCQQISDALPPSVGVFEDDPVLLGLAERSRLDQPMSPCLSGSDELADPDLEDGRQACCLEWDL